MKRNGIGIILKLEFTKDVIEVRRLYDKVLEMKLEIGKEVVNVVSAYAPQVGCDKEEKEEFWKTMDETVYDIPRNERIFASADLNGHVGEGNAGDEEVMGTYGLGARKDEGEMAVQFATRFGMAFLNTYFRKKMEQQLIYKSGGNKFQADYVLCRRDNLPEVSECKVLHGDSVVKQHRMVVCRIKLVTRVKRGYTVEPNLR